MPLLTCPDCGRQVSDRAPACPGCGAPLAQDLVGGPSAGSAGAAMAGRQRSRLRGDLGNAIGLIGVAAAIVIGVSTGSLGTGITLALIALGAGIWVGYRA